METKAEMGSEMFQTIIYIVLVLLLFSLNYASLSAHKNGTGVWQEYYSNEIVKSLELSKPGDKITLDIQNGVTVAGKNSFNDFEKMFTYNDDSREVCVQFSYKAKTCYYYFNNITIEKMDVNFNSDSSLLIINIKSIK